MTISGFIAYVKQVWKNKPDTSTPLSAARLTHLEDGIKGNSDAIDKIAAAVLTQIVNDPNKIASMAALFSVNEAVKKVNSDLGGITGVESLIYNLKWIPGEYIDNPNAHLKLTGWGIDAYISRANLTASSRWSLVLGIYDHNNGTPMGRQFAIGTSKCMERRYFNGTWQSWVDK